MVGPWEGSALSLANVSWDFICNAMEITQHIIFSERVNLIRWLTFCKCRTYLISEIYYILSRPPEMPRAMTDTEADKQRHRQDAQPCRSDGFISCFIDLNVLNTSSRCCYSNNAQKHRGTETVKHFGKQSYKWLVNLVKLCGLDCFASQQ